MAMQFRCGSCVLTHEQGTDKSQPNCTTQFFDLHSSLFPHPYPRDQKEQRTEKSQPSHTKEGIAEKTSPAARKKPRAVIGRCHVHRQTLSLFCDNRCGDGRVGRLLFACTVVSRKFHLDFGWGWVFHTGRLWAGFVNRLRHGKRRYFGSGGIWRDVWCRHVLIKLLRVESTRRWGGRLNVRREGRRNRKSRRRCLCGRERRVAGNRCEGLCGWRRVCVGWQGCRCPGAGWCDGGCPCPGRRCRVPGCGRGRRE